MPRHVPNVSKWYFFKLASGWRVGGYTQPEPAPASARCSFLEETFPGAVEREGIHLPGGVVAVDGIFFLGVKKQPKVLTHLNRPKK